MPLFKSNIDDPHKANRDDGDEFAFDHVMGRFNRHETFRADHDPDLHKKTPAPSHARKPTPTWFCRISMNDDYGRSMFVEIIEVYC